MHCRPSHEDNYRFIPNRASSSLHLQGELAQSSGFSFLLRAQLFGDHWKSPRLKYSSRQPNREKENLPCPIMESTVSSPLPDFQRILPKLPYKVLDAPKLLDDFYVNVLDWSSRDWLAVGLTSEVYLWNAKTTEVMRLAYYARTHVTSLAWDRSGNTLAVGLDTGKVQVFDLEKLQLIRDLAGHASRVGVLDWGPVVLSSAGKDRKIIHRDLRESKDFLVSLFAHRQEVCGLKWAPDGQQLASGGNDNRVKIWSLHRNFPVTRLDQHTAAVKALAWSPHQHGLLATGGGTADRSIRLWNTLDESSLVHTETQGQVCSLLFSRNTNELVSVHGYCVNQVLLWKSPSLSRMGVLTGHTNRVLYMSLSADGSNLVTGAGDETLRFWRLFPIRDTQEGPSELDLSFGELR